MWFTVHCRMGWRGVVLIWCTWAAGVEGVGGAKLWDLGFGVEENPLTVFVMFCFVVFLTVCIEVAKHNAEHGMKDKHRKQALVAVYAELMMVGVISFLLILTAELGVLDIRIGSCDTPSNAPADPNTPLPAPSAPYATPLASKNPSSSASGSGSEECGIGFDLILFEYAHLVLFFMGLTYCCFIMVAFVQRDRICAEISTLQDTPLSEWLRQKPKPMSVSGIMGAYLCIRGGPWARSILTLRAAIILEHEKRLKKICDPSRVALEHKIAKHKRIHPPGQLPRPDEAVHKFDIARFAKIATSEVLIHLLHIPAVVWCVVLVIAATNVLHRAGISLSYAVVIMAFFGPFLGIFLLWRISIHMSQVVQRASGHPGIARVPYMKGPINGPPPREALEINPKYVREGLAWSEGGEDPWEILTGCIEDGTRWDFLDPLDPRALEIQIQAVIFASCFYTGQVCMLSTLIYETSGIAALIFCWLSPVPPLVFWVPRALMIYALTHRSKEAPESWLTYALKQTEDPEDHNEHNFHEDDSYMYLGDGTHMADKEGYKMPYQSIDIETRELVVNDNPMRVPRTLSPTT
eukprot:TRINITY_DN16475_c0_g1_i1.p1 TRINITY_DN16475_c0_g1~~TRINITY_DN16475_c0_g1_i1.p1  ORF type:complete len:577 (+),score=69.76 TRINITY_DN16475_c0_g1_i1:965-2695(+)